MAEFTPTEILTFNGINKIKYFKKSVEREHFKIKYLFILPKQAIVESAPGQREL